MNLTLAIRQAHAHRDITYIRMTNVDNTELCHSDLLVGKTFFEDEVIAQLAKRHIWSLQNSFNDIASGDACNEISRATVCCSGKLPAGDNSRSTRVIGTTRQKYLLTTHGKLRRIVRSFNCKDCGASSSQH